MFRAIKHGTAIAMDQILLNTIWIALCLISMAPFSNTSRDTTSQCRLQSESGAGDDVTPGDIIMAATRQQVTTLQGVLLPLSPPPTFPFMTRSKRRYIPKEDLAPQPQEEMHTRVFHGGRQLAMPWSCEGAAFWRDLGSDHHPRYVREVSCEQKFCWFGHYKCQPRKFIVKVLHRISSPAPECSADLDGKWRLKDVSLTLYCECGP